MDPREANLFLHLVNELYERSSIILILNKAPNQWGELMNDQGITTATLDCYFTELKSFHFMDCYRIKHTGSQFFKQRVFVT
ncbi:ATP-binding protein [Peribacillus simplex]|uniref:ATP-binding protein n=1 Tax=Peribacillus simplex TaxID=1478 RepID=UPI00367201D8